MEVLIMKQNGRFFRTPNHRKSSESLIFLTTSTDREIVGTKTQIFLGGATILI